jgi:hypothetical protein
MHLTAPVHSPHTGRDRLDQVVAIRRNDGAIVGMRTQS